jgi:hypothetical protein
MAIWTRFPDTCIAGLEYVEIGSTSLSTITRISRASSSTRGAIIKGTLKRRDNSKLVDMSILFELRLKCAHASGEATLSAIPSRI